MVRVAIHTTTGSRSRGSGGSDDRGGSDSGCFLSSSFGSSLGSIVLHGLTVQFHLLLGHTVHPGLGLGHLVGLGYLGDQLCLVCLESIIISDSSSLFLTLKFQNELRDRERLHTTTGSDLNKLTSLLGSLALAVAVLPSGLPAVSLGVILVVVLLSVLPAVSLGVLLAVVVLLSGLLGKSLGSPDDAANFGLARLGIGSGLGSDLNEDWYLIGNRKLDGLAC